MRLAFVGLGVMGYPMAGHLVNAGHDVTVYNRTKEKAQRWAQQYGGQAVDTPREAAENADIIFCCVGNDDDVRSVVYGDQGILAGASEGAVLVDHTTASAELAKELADKCAAQSIGFLDAPVSGGQAGAENGVLTIMVGGDEATFERVKPVMDAYARFSQLMGIVGSGQLAKMVNQICIAGLVQGLAEGFSFAEKVGLDPKKLVDTISKGAAGSWQMENRYQTMFAGEYDFGFAVDWMRKDLAIAFEEAKKHDVALPVTQLVDSYYSEIQKMGGNRWDTSSLIARFKS
ncbi:NAD(P)-dependent oxidoreductase [Thalassotalea agarivorans]|uniref:2-hydroxy-3-oxopropionate reductase n=1 Tax=Thalassotalea agarivorans TaxID=349064 RepID=A0A1I0C084_THASX|nr:NAD(P)-dependent oxidoreductase [Thalassotalea agarivorans]SET12737.1 2-hydroxy-3-oxopropionate reductase [Thalassotalea agarivorans]